MPPTDRMTAAEFKATKLGRQLHRASTRGGKLVLANGRKPNSITMLRRIAAKARREGRAHER